MRYQPLSRRLINLIYPLVIYMAIGMAVLGLYPNGGLIANLIEKVSCIIIMGILFYKDSKQIRWEGKKLSLYSAIIMIIIGICACIGVNMLFELTGLKTIREEDAKNVAKALYSDKLWLQILVVGIAAPVAEELLFRGILYRRMRTWLSVGPSALAALLIFPQFMAICFRHCTHLFWEHFLFGHMNGSQSLQHQLFCMYQPTSYPFLYSKAHGLAAICRHMQWLPASLVLQEQLQELCILQFTNKPETIAPRGFHEQ